MIWALHGAFGNAGDWDELGSQPGPVELKAPDLWDAKNDANLTDWAEQFNQLVAASDPEPILLGYSMGARLGLHALLEAAQMWKGAVLVSAHPGLRSKERREARRARDDRWLKRFDDLEWTEFRDEWNAQTVFGAAVARPLLEKRDGMRKGLDLWSLAEQRDLVPDLHRIMCPLIWVTGRRDAKFTAIAEAAVPQLPNAQHLVVDDAGHRVPWDAAEKFRDLVRSFVESL